MLQGQAGNAVQYITRNQALKKLQLTLSEFRRLCILKGIHPREPKKKTQGAHKTYYHVKDIGFLLHEPLLNKIREIASHEKKIKRALAKKNRPLAHRISSRRPEYRLDHLVKERYPSLVDALRDLDDPLTLVHLFAVLPADATKNIPSDKVQLSRRLALEWQAYVVASHTLRKSFVSLKGFYYQAEIKGQLVTWMVPHLVSQVLPNDVDFKVMLTFLELYQSTLQFVMFSLYHEMGIAYPLKVDDDIDCAGAGAITLASSSNIISQVEESQKSNARVEAMTSKIAKLEEEIKAMDGPSKPRDEKADEDSIDDDEMSDYGEDVMIDGAEEESEEQKSSSDEGEEESGSSEDEDPENNVDIEPAPSEVDKKKMQQPGSSSVDPSLVGGASDVADEGEICSSLFRGLKFFLGREVPKEQLSLVIRSFGGAVGWDGEGSPFEETDAGITHHVIDRPKPLREHNDRIFVQPQWVFDSANAQVLVLCNKYAPGKVPPPHLSPFVKPGEDDYIPEYAKEVQALKDAAQRLRQQAAGKAVDDEFLGRMQEGNAMDKQADLEKIEERHAQELAQELRAVGKAVSPPTPSSKKNKPKENEKEEEDQMKDIMMTRKVKRAYQRAMQEKAAKRAKSARLEKRAASLKNKQ